eukprot:CAMPEP_0184328906 /NCGR_PEP_ID=MMETSP1049-20130417/143868_1 /TAXON_ID=77928 /ORGANISM="Proteomonas sulcata, Strain CCMP704" /LENGTH=344 /DNA_ID=CAMNT_0026651241 /DNA_START=1181 /DNA_END=2215 /DNA_ORIENTATION=-
MYSLCERVGWKSVVTDWANRPFGPHSHQSLTPLADLRSQSPAKMIPQVLYGSLVSTWSTAGNFRAEFPMMNAIEDVGSTLISTIHSMSWSSATEKISLSARLLSIGVSITSMRRQGNGLNMMIFLPLSPTANSDSLCAPVALLATTVKFGRLICTSVPSSTPTNTKAGFPAGSTTARPLAPPFLDPSMRTISPTVSFTSSQLVVFMEMATREAAPAPQEARSILCWVLYTMYWIPPQASGIRSVSDFRVKARLPWPEAEMATTAEGLAVEATKASPSPSHTIFPCSDDQPPVRADGKTSSPICPWRGWFMDELQNALTRACARSPDPRIPLFGGTAQQFIELTG